MTAMPQHGSHETASQFGEEAKTLDLSIGDTFHLRVTVRPTRGALVTAGLLAAAVIVPAVWLVASRRAARERHVDLEATARSWG